MLNNTVSAKTNDNDNNNDNNNHNHNQKNTRNRHRRRRKRKEEEHPPLYQLVLLQVVVGNNLCIQISQILGVPCHSMSMTVIPEFCCCPAATKSTWSPPPLDNLDPERSGLEGIRAHSPHGDSSSHGWSCWRLTAWEQTGHQLPVKGWLTHRNKWRILSGVIKHG